MNKKLNILLTNDDGVRAEGIIHLAEKVKPFGNVTIVAPETQCSGMSQKLTINADLVLRKQESYPVAGVEAYSLSGTPVDCVDVAVTRIMPVRPDYVFSGINYGYNAGFDAASSGTVGASLEALIFGIPTIAFSNGVPEGAVFSGAGANYEVIDATITDIIQELLHTEIEKSAFWNVNFPGCSLAEYNGILRNRSIAQLRPYSQNFIPVTTPDGNKAFRPSDSMISREEAPDGSDIHAVLNNFISIGKIYNNMLI